MVFFQLESFSVLTINALIIERIADKYNLCYAKCCLVTSYKIQFCNQPFLTSSLGFPSGEASGMNSDS